MICEIICVNGFLCMLHLDIVHISSVCVHIICILSEHMRIMHILSAPVLHMFFCFVVNYCMDIISHSNCSFHPTPPSKE